MEDIGKTGMIPFTYFNGIQKRARSTFLRVDGVTKVDSGFEKWVHGGKYDNLIFQKAYWTDMMKMFDGPKILDLCDPDWLQDSLDIVEVGALVHAITCSSAELTSLVKRYFPEKLVFHLPDRLNFNLYPAPRNVHKGEAKNIVWFGFVHNAHETLRQMAPVIKKYDLKLHIIADRPYSEDDDIMELQPEFTLYNPIRINDQLKEADIVLNPRSQRAFYKYKSNNKTIIGWKLGLPVAVTSDELERFIDPLERNAEVSEKRILVENEYDVSKSAAQYREIIAKIRSKYF